MRFLSSIGLACVVLATSVSVRGHWQGDPDGLYAWFEKLEYGAVLKGTFVKLDGQFVYGGSTPQKYTAYGFLVSDENGIFEIITPTLQRERFPATIRQGYSREATYQPEN